MTPRAIFVWAIEALNRVRFDVSSKDSHGPETTLRFLSKTPAKVNERMCWVQEKKLVLVVIPSSVFISNMGVCLEFAESVIVLLVSEF